MKDSTRDIILQVATQLFADKGFDGVSVRDIAKQANVNLAAVNYHFENKVGLFSESLNWSVSTLVEELEQIYVKTKSLSVVEYVGHMHDHFLKNDHHFKTTFKFFLSMSDVMAEIKVCSADKVGPPGGEILARLIKQEHSSLKKSDLEWAVRAICAQAFHVSFIACNRPIMNNQAAYHLSPQKIRKDLLRTTRAILAAL